MGSYVISASLGTGCYRHIRIKETATLFALHAAILRAFGFEDDHMHAFFLDNRAWSDARAYISEKTYYAEKLTRNYTLKKLGLKPGDKFKYIFDFGEEWLFQCRVLRMTEETSDIPYILRSVGEAPEQYPDAEDYDDAEIEAWLDSLPKPYPEEELKALYAGLPLSKETADKLRSYCAAAARIYGIAPLRHVYELYCRYEETIPWEDFLACTELLRHEELFFYVLGKESLYEEAEPSAPGEREIVHELRRFSGPELYYIVSANQKKKPFFIPEREELLFCTEENERIPETTQAAAMLRFLQKEYGDKEPGMRATLLLIHMIAAEYPTDDIGALPEMLGLRFDLETMKRFFALWQELNNHTRKFANRGFTPVELSNMRRKT